MNNCERSNGSKAAAINYNQQRLNVSTVEESTPVKGPGLVRGAYKTETYSC